jgi:amino acid adenylation domain-containing protein
VNVDAGNVAESVGEEDCTRTSMNVGSITPSSDSQDVATCWRQRLADAPPPPVLPVDAESAAVGVGRVSRQLPATLWRGLQDDGQALGVSPLAWCVATTSIWLRGLSNREDFLVGALTEPAAVTGAAAWAGCVPVRVLVERHSRFASVARAIHRQLEAATQLGLPVHARSRAISGDAPPPYGAVVAVGSTVGQGVDPNGVQALPPGCDIAVTFDGESTELTIELLYNTTRLTGATASRFLEYLAVVLNGALVDSARAVSELPLLTAFERDLLFRHWQGLPLVYPHEQPFHRLFERQAELTPDAVALVFEGRELCYADLNRHANRVAKLLQSKGCELETRVGVYMENSLELAVAVLAVFKAGGAYVPLAPGHPDKHLQYIANDTALKLVLTESSRTNRLELTGVELVELSLDSEPDSEAANSELDVAGANLCAVLYTSGSTGTPKGVELSHQALLSRVYWMQEVGGLESTDRHVLIAPMHIARFVGQLFWPLLTGARMYITRPGGDKDNAYLLALIRENGISSIHLGPTIARMFLLRPAELRAATSLRNVFCSGEAFPADLQVELKAHLPRARLHKCYGLAETNFVTYCLYGDPRQTPTVGRVNYMKVYILDEHLDPVPVGVAGEICSSGIGLARGFANKPGLVAQRFVPDPFSDRPGERLYRTGDLGRWLPDGNIEFLGRMDHQVKIRGYPVNLGEIEACLAKHQGLGAAVVVTHASRSGDVRLVAYIVPKVLNEAPAPAELRDYLVQHLPSYMIPTTFVTLAEIPLRGGKIDRQGLPEPPKLRPLPESTFSPPREGVEQTLAKLWEDILDLRPVGREDSFFELGGHSLLVVRLVSRIAVELNVELGVPEVFLNPTIAALASVILGREHRAAAQIRPTEVRDLYELTPMQESFYSLDQVERAAAYNCKVCVEIEGPLALDRLQAACDATVAKHEAMRARFVWSDGAPRQAFAPSASLKVNLADFSGSKPTDQRVLDYFAQRISERRDIAQLGLFAATCVRLRDDRHLFLLVAPHIISDGWSMNVVLRDIMSYYAQASAPADPPLPFQYKDFVAWYRDWLSGPQALTHQKYWYNKLGGKLPSLDLASDYPRPALKSTRGRSAYFTFTKPEVELLGELSQKLAVTPFMLLVALIKLVLFARSGQPDIVVGTPMAGRLSEQLEGQVGNYINVVALRDHVDLAQTFGGFVADVKQTILEAHEHQRYPFDNLTYELDAPVDLSRNVIFDVLVAYHNYRNLFELGARADGLTVRPLPVSGRTSRFDLSFDFYEHEEQTLLELEYADEMFSRPNVDGLFALLTSLLVRGATNPQGSLRELLNGVEQRAAE